ncbi:MAG: glycosyltransferase [Gemmatimonadaceae bacterium]
MTHNRPTLLAVSPVPPWPASDGMALRVSRLITELVRSWSIVLICPSGGESGSANGVELSAEINIPKNSKWMYLPTQYDVAPVVRLVADAIRAYQPQVALLWGGMDYLKQELPEMPPAVNDRVDCMTLSAWRQLLLARGRTIARRLNQLADVAWYELRVRRGCDATVVVGESDARVLRTLLGVRNVHVVPNGVEMPIAQPVARSAQPTVMFTGVMNYQPNIDAVLYFVRDVWPTVRKDVPDAVFQIVGRSPTPEILALRSERGVEVHADVRSVQEFLARAWLAVAPMRTGSGIKNKVLEAWSTGTPAVMTPIASNGLRQAPSELLLTADGDALADSISDLLTDRPRRTRLGELARQTARNLFSWRGQANALNGLLKTAAG